MSKMVAIRNVSLLVIHLSSPKRATVAPHLSEVIGPSAHAGLSIHRCPSVLDGLVENPEHLQEVRYQLVAKDPWQMFDEIQKGRVKDGFGVVFLSGGVEVVTLSAFGGAFVVHNFVEEVVHIF